jgi:hypothetical protein
MEYWTKENTDGFNAAELDMLNLAQSELMRRHPDIEAANICDSLNNAFHKGISYQNLMTHASFQ